MDEIIRFSDSWRIYTRHTINMERLEVQAIYLGNEGGVFSLVYDRFVCEVGLLRLAYNREFHVLISFFFLFLCGVQGFMGS